MSHQARGFCEELYELVFQTDNGRVFRSGLDSNVFMIEYGNMFINMNCCNFNRFTDFLSNTQEEDIKKMILPSINKIVIQPMKSLGCYAFTLEQFLELRVLVEESRQIAKIQNEVHHILNSKK